MPKESYIDHVTNKINTFKKNIIRKISTSAFIEGIQEDMNSITRQVEKGVKLTEIKNKFDKLKDKLLELYIAEGGSGNQSSKDSISYSWNLKKTGRSIWNYIAGNYSHSEANINNLEKLNEDLNNKEYSKYKPCMRNMLKLLDLKNTTVDWMKRLEVMSDEKFVQSDFFIFGTTTRWNDYVCKAAENLKEALKNLKIESLKDSDDYNLLFSGDVKKIFLDTNFHSNYSNSEEHSIGKKVDHPIFPKFDYKNTIVSKIITKSDSKLLKFTTSKREISVITENGNKRLKSVLSGELIKEKTKKRMIERIFAHEKLTPEEINEEIKEIKKIESHDI